MNVNPNRLYILRDNLLGNGIMNGYVVNNK